MNAITKPVNDRDNPNAITMKDGKVTRMPVDYLINVFRDYPTAKDLLDNINKQSSPIGFSYEDKQNANLLLDSFGRRDLLDLNPVEIALLEVFYTNHYPEIDFADYASDHPDFEGNRSGMGF